jgi:hypothetical protein
LLDRVLPDGTACDSARPAENAAREAASADAGTLPASIAIASGFGAVVKE